MAGVWMRARVLLRSEWRATLSLALIIGIAAGAAIAAAAGARRTATAYPRFLEAQDAYDALTGGGEEEDFERRFAAIPRLPEVERAALTVLVGAELTVPARASRPERVVRFPDVLLTVEPSGEYLYTTNKAKIVAGRLPDRSSAREIAVPFTIADRYGIRAGDTLVAGVGFDESFGPARRIPVLVAGIVAAPGDFEAVGQTSYPLVYATPALFEQNRDVIPPKNADTWSYAVHLRGGSSAAPAFKQKVEEELHFDVPLIEPVQTAGVQKSMRLYAAALWLLAALIAIAAIVVAGQTLARQIVLDSSQFSVLRALGLGRRALVASAMMRALTVGAAAAVIAGVVAFVASPLTPIGTARIAEPDPGFHLDVAVVGFGVLGVVVITALIALYPAFRAARVAALPDGWAQLAPSRGSRVVGAVSRITRSPAAVTGLRMALEPGRGRTAVPVRSTIVAVAVGIASVTASIVAGASLGNLLETPALAGFTYDAILPSSDEGNDDDAARAASLRAMPEVLDVTEGTALNVDFEGVDSFLVAYRPTERIGFAMIDGDAPRAGLRTVGGARLPEVALGPATMRRLDARVGEVVEFAFSTADARSRTTQRAIVAGTAAIPALPWAATEPGEGAAMTLDAVRSFTDDEGGCCYARFRDGVDLAAARTKLEGAGFETFLRTKRADLQTLERITGLPVFLSTIFALIALAALAHVLTSAIRRRRRDLAILKTIGFVASQVRATIAWQASAIAIVCVLVGIPAGIALGRWGWRVIADQFGVVPVPVNPVVMIALAAPVAIVVANAIALLPARAAVRTRPGAVLRVE